MINQDSIEALQARLPELEWYAKQQGLRVEPYLYPKGLFRSGRRDLTRFSIDAFVSEIKTDLQRLASHTEVGGRVHLSGLIQQKINVLVNSFRSQHLRKPKMKPLDNLLHEVEQADQNVFDYLCGKASAKAIRRIQSSIEKSEQQRVSLNVTLQKKERELQQPAADPSKLTPFILALKQQLGHLNQTITREKEHLNRLLTT